MAGSLPSETSTTAAKASLSIVNVESEAIITSLDNKGTRPIWLGPDTGEWDHARLHRVVLRDERLGAIELALYWALIDHGNPASGLCWPSVVTLAHLIKTSDRTVQRALRVLAAADYIEIERIKGKSNRYWLLPAIHTPETVSPVKVSDELTPEPQSPPPETVSPVPPTQFRTKEKQVTRSKEEEPTGIDNFCHACGFYRDKSYPLVSQCIC